MGSCVPQGLAHGADQDITEEQVIVQRGARSTVIWVTTNETTHAALR